MVLAGIGGNTIESMLENTTSKEISDWMVYNSIVPIKQDANTYMIAQLTSALANVNGVKASPGDYMPQTIDEAISGESKKLSVSDKLKATFPCPKT
jgi:hypothetical protein